MLKARPFTTDERKRFFESVMPARTLERFRRMEMEREKEDGPRDRGLKDRMGDKNTDGSDQPRKTPAKRKL